MTLASWFSSMRHSRRRLTRTGARRNRSRAFHRRASFEALEDRVLLSTVSFSTGGETVNESAGTFSIPVTLSGARHSHRLPLRLRVQRTRWPGLRRRRQPLRRRRRRPHGEQGDARGGGQHLRLRVPEFHVALRPGLRLGRQPLRRRRQRDNTVSEVTPAGTVSTFASGFDDPDGLAFDAGRQPLRRQRRQRHGEQGDARGGGQHLRLRVQRSRRPGLRRRRQPLRRQRRQPTR